MWLRTLFIVFFGEKAGNPVVTTPLFALSQGVSKTVSLQDGC